MNKKKIASYILRPFIWVFIGLKWMGTIIVVLVAIFASYLIYMAGKVSYPTKSSYTTDTEIVHIQLDGKVPLDIPKAYLTSRRTWKGGEQEMVDVDAMLPDMQAVSLAAEIPEEERLYINLEGGYDDRRVFYTQNAETQYKKLIPYLDDIGFGLKKLNDSYYAANSEGLVGSMAFSKHWDYYLVRFPDGRRIRISCGKTAPRCRVSKDFDGRISGSYSVHRKYIPVRWKEVDDKVTHLIQSFRQNPAQTE